MITGVHLIIYSKDAEADKLFFRDVLKFTNVDVGHGWLIFGLPPAGLAVNPSSENDKHEIYLMCEDIKTFVRQMKKREIACGEIQNEPWGQLIELILPGGGKLGVYQPRHETPEPEKGKQPKQTLSKR